MITQKISIIGCGRVGTALAFFLSKEGYKIGGVLSKTDSSAQNCVNAAGQGRVCSSLIEAVSSGGIIFITTPDHLIGQICCNISQLDSDTSSIAEKIIFHCSGALSSCILNSAAEKGAATGSIHPLQSFAPYCSGQESPFTDINVSIEGSGKAVAIGKEIIEALGAGYFTIPTNKKTLYHAAAVAASNYLVTLQHFALSLLKEAGIPEKKGYEILEPLIQGTLNNIKNRGSIESLTGPIARGDAQIVEKHLNDINEILPEFGKLYKVMGQYTLKLAEKREKIDQVSIEALTDILNGLNN